MALKDVDNFAVGDKAAIRRLIEQFSIPEPNSGCWLWVGALDGDYGQASFKGSSYRAHRLSFVAWRNTPIGSLFVCHKCDVPACVNPNHLFLGTHGDNMVDCVSKGRHRAPLTKLSAISAAAIFADSREQRAIADAYGIGQSQISRIKNRVTWVRATAHLAQPGDSTIKRGRPRKYSARIVAIMQNTA